MIFRVTDEAHCYLYIVAYKSNSTGTKILISRELGKMKRGCKVERPKIEILQFQRMFMPL